MYQNIPVYYSNQDDRLGFLGPFILGGLAGGLISPFFYNGGYYPNQGYPQPYYNYNNYYYPYYGPYYRNK